MKINLEYFDIERTTIGRDLVSISTRIDVWPKNPFLYIDVSYWRGSSQILYIVYFLLKNAHG